MINQKQKNINFNFRLLKLINLIYPNIKYLKILSDHMVIKKRWYSFRKIQLNIHTFTKDVILEYIIDQSSKINNYDTFHLLEKVIRTDSDYDLVKVLYEEYCHLCVLDLFKPHIEIEETMYSIVHTKKNILLNKKMSEIDKLVKEYKKYMNTKYKTNLYLPEYSQ